MRTEWKIRFFLLALAILLTIAAVAAFKLPSRRAVIKNEDSDIKVQKYIPEEIDVSTRIGFITQTVNIYERITETTVKIPDDNPVKGENESLVKAVTLGIIEPNDKAFYSDGDGISAQAAADITYKAVAAADSSFKIGTEEANHILNGEYNNSVLDGESRRAYAFMLKHAVIPYNFVENQLLPMSAQEARRTAENTERIFCPEIEFSVDEKTVVIGESSASLISKFGNPNRIDMTHLGFEWYVYNSDYSRFMMVGVRGGAVCAFFSNCEKLETDSLPDTQLNMYRNEQTGEVDAIYRGAPVGQTVEMTDEIRINQGLELLDMLNAARKKQRLPVFINNSALAVQALDESRRFALGNFEVGAEKELTRLCADDIFACYEEMLSLRHEAIWKYSPKLASHGAVGVWENGAKIYVTMLADDSGRVVPNPAEEAVIAKKEYPSIGAGKAAVFAPIDGAKVADGEPLLFMFGGLGAESYHIDIQNCETRDYVVNADITGDLHDYRVSADRFDGGLDYEVCVKAYYGGNQVLEHNALIEYGAAKPIEILSPTQQHVLTESEISIVWRAPLYTDFQIDIINADGTSAASTRVIDETQTNVSELIPGKYTVRVSAMRRDSNAVKTYSENMFEITEPPKPTPIAYTAGAPVFKTNRYSAVFGSGVAVYTTKEQADANMVTIKIPVWHLDKNGAKVPAAANLTVNRAVANEVLEIFTVIYNSPEKFPIKSVGGYNWRSTATGGKSHHSYGTAIDINPTENYCIYNTGRRIGSHWKPYTDPYSMPADGDVVRIFKSYGWTWGGDWKSLKDYMHFSYLGG